MRAAPAAKISLEEKARFFRYGAKNLGATALCLSGGASFGYCELHVPPLATEPHRSLRLARPLWRRARAPRHGLAAEGHHRHFRWRH